jgi:hypothetical protein
VIASCSPLPTKWRGGVGGGGSLSEFDRAVTRGPTPNPSPPRAARAGGGEQRLPYSIFKQPLHRHCERSEAIQKSRHSRSLDCFVASLLAMTAFRTWLNIPATQTAPEFCFVATPMKNRGRREDRVRAAPAVSRAKCTSQKRTRAYRFSGNTPAFPAQWFYGLLRALPGDRAFLPPSPSRIAPQELDTSVGVSGPHDFAVRVNVVRLATHPASTASRPAFVTIASRPSVWDGMALNVPLIWGRERSRRDAAFQHDGQMTHNTHARIARRADTARTIWGISKAVRTPPSREPLRRRHMRHRWQWEWNRIRICRRRRLRAWGL